MEEKEIEVVLALPLLLLARWATKFDVEVALAAATITDIVLGRDLLDTPLGDGSGMISGWDID